MKTTSALRDQETWLRREGLGLIIPWRRRLPRLLGAMAPFMVFVILVNVALGLMLDVTDGMGDAALEDLEFTTTQLVTFVAGMAALLMSVPAALLYQRWQRTRLVWVQRTAAVTLAISWLVTCLLFRLSILETFLILALVVLVIYLEIPSMLRWAGVTVVRSLSLLGPMVVHVLPFLLLAQLLVFFTGEMWRMAYYLDKPRMWAVCGLLFAPTVLLTWSQSTTVLRTHLDQDLDGEALLAGTPFESLRDHDKRHLRRAERINLALLPTITQLIQVLLFVVVVFGFFLAFGSVALTPELISKWTAQDPVRMVWLGIRMPIDLTLFRVSMMLAIFSGLSFAASNATDATYRDVFLAPIVNDMERGLAARRRYGAWPRSALNNAE